MIDFVLKEGFDVKNLSFSPITGGDGNIEFLLHLQWNGSKVMGEKNLLYFPSDIVRSAHEQLKRKQSEE